MTAIVRVCPLKGALGTHDARSSYVEYFWLPVIGPSCVWLLRRVAEGFDESPGGFDLDVEVTARSLGLGTVNLHHTIKRLVGFELAAWSASNTLGVCTMLPPLSYRQASRLPAELVNRLPVGPVA